MNSPRLDAARSGPGLERGGTVEDLVLGTRDPDQIDLLFDGLCTNTLGAGISQVLFRETSVGVVRGVRLHDGRRVVVKAHQPRESLSRLAAVHHLQTGLFRAGLPCPEPLISPVRFINGNATVETLIDQGEFRDTHDPVCRRLVAEALAWHLTITGAQLAPVALNSSWSLFDGDGLWPAQPHAPIFDFAATSHGAEWIDSIARRAKAKITQSETWIAGHSDWSGKHFRFAGPRITAIYDWDSLANRSEAAIVGIAAMTYTTRFDLPGVRRAPDPGEMTAFIDEYSAARGSRLSRAQRIQIAAHALLIAAYTARCEHCAIDGYDGDADTTSFTTALRTHGERYLDA